MIYIGIQVWPRGDRNKAQIINSALIYNTGKGTSKEGDYAARFYDAQLQMIAKQEGIRHMRNKGVWELLRVVLGCMGKALKADKPRKGC